MIPFQIEIIKMIQSVHSPLLDTLFEWVTMMGEELFFLVVMAFLIWAVDKEKGVRMGFILLSGMMVNTLLKIAVNSERPIGQPGIRSLRVETANGASFPSGHTQNATSFWTSLALLFKKRQLLVLGVLCTLLVGVSRLYLGVHWPVDVLGGIVIGVFWAFLVNRALGWVEAHNRRIWIFYLSLPLLVLSLMSGNELYVKATGTLVGFVIGYILEYQYVGYKCVGPFKKRLLGFLICLAVLILLKSGLKVVLPKELLFEAIRYALVGAWVTLGGPWILKNRLVK